MKSTEELYSLLREPDPAEWDELIDEAIATFDPENPWHLVSLMLDDDPISRRRGLFIFGELGKKGAVVLDDALVSVSDPDPMARNSVMEGVLSHRLSPAQAREVLKLADDPEELVRGKVVATLGAADQATIRDAIDLVDGPRRSEFENAILLFEADPSSAQALFDHALTEVSVAATFALASIERMARRGLLQSAPTFDGDGFLGDNVRRNTARLIRRAIRMRESGRDV